MDAVPIPLAPSAATYATQATFKFFLWLLSASRSPAYPFISEWVNMRSYKVRFTSGEMRRCLESGEDVIVQHGAHILMDETVVSSIVNCFTAMRIISLNDLHTETSWSSDWINIGGKSLLNVILEHLSLPEDDIPMSLDPPAAASTLPPVASEP